MRRVRALVLDNPVMDLVANCPSAVCAEYGLRPGGSCTDMPAALRAQLFDHVRRLSPTEVPGGGALNTLRAMSWMLPDTVERELTALGVVGTDAAAVQLTDAFQLAGVTAQFDKTDMHATGQCAVLITEDRDRCIVADAQAARMFESAHLRKHQTQLDAADWCCIPAYFVTGPEARAAAAKAAAEAVHAAGHTLSVSLSSAQLLRRLRAADQLHRVDAVVQCAAWVFCNQDEFLAYFCSQHSTLPLGEPSDWVGVAALAVREHGYTGSVVITQGAKATVVIESGSCESFAVSELVPQHQIQDLNGAGDAFAGGFIAALAMGREIRECVQAGHFCAAQVIQLEGCTFPETCLYDWGE